MRSQVAIIAFEEAGSGSDNDVKPKEDSLHRGDAYMTFEKIVPHTIRVFGSLCGECVTLASRLAEAKWSLVYRPSDDVSRHSFH